jgi:hypothetical protein
VVVIENTGSIPVKLDGDIDIDVNDVDGDGVVDDIEDYFGIVENSATFPAVFSDGAAFTLKATFTTLETASQGEHFTGTITLPFTQAQ